jgi:hypothetical protein
MLPVPTRKSINSKLPVYNKRLSVNDATGTYQSQAESKSKHHAHDTIVHSKTKRLSEDTCAQRPPFCQHTRIQSTTSRDTKASSNKPNPSAVKKKTINISQTSSTYSLSTLGTLHGLNTTHNSHHTAPMVNMTKTTQLRVSKLHTTVATTTSTPTRSMIKPPSVSNNKTTNNVGAIRTQKPTKLDLLKGSSKLPAIGKTESQDERRKSFHFITSTTTTTASSVASITTIKAKNQNVRNPVSNENCPIASKIKLIDPNPKLNLQHTKKTQFKVVNK